MDSKGKKKINAPLANVFPVEMGKNNKMTFGDGTQEDAEEFMTHAINMLLEENSPDVNDNIQYEDDDDEEYEYTPSRFHQELKALLTIEWSDMCDFSCRHKSEIKNSPERIISLPLPTTTKLCTYYKEDISVQFLLDYFFWRNMI